MQAGLLNEPITILKPEITRNEFGEQTTEYVESYHTRARVINNGGNRTQEDNGVFYDYSKHLEVRYYVPLDNFDIVVFKGQKYRVKSVEKTREYNNQTIYMDLMNE